MKKSFTVVVSILCALLVASCNENLTPASEYKITYNVDDAATQTIYGETVTVCYKYVPDAVIPFTQIGFGARGEGLYMNGEIAVGSYTFADGEYETMNGMDILVDVNGLDMSYGAGEGKVGSSITINVTSVADNVVEGTFSAIVSPNYADDTTLPQKTIRNGTFKVQKCTSNI
jgi:hypothetical protein